MCHYITACLAGDVALDRLRPIAKSHRQVLRPLENPWVKAQLPAGYRYLSCTSKWCDCGTCLGWTTREHAERLGPDDPSRLRRKGWSEARSQRWLEERKKARERAEHAREGGAPREEAAAWVAYIRDLLDQPGVTSFGLLLH